MIGSNNILNKKVIHRKPTTKSIEFCQPFNIKNNEFYKYQLILTFHNQKDIQNLPWIKLQQQKM